MLSATRSRGENGMSHQKVQRDLLSFIEGVLAAEWANTPDRKKLIISEGVRGKFPCTCEDCKESTVLHDTRSAWAWLKQHDGHQTWINFTEYSARAAAASGGDAEAAEPIDRSELRSLLAKIEKLRRLADNNPEENEARAAAEKAEALLARYRELLDEIDELVE